MGHIHWVRGWMRIAWSHSQCRYKKYKYRRRCSCPCACPVGIPDSGRYISLLLDPGTRGRRMGGFTARQFQPWERGQLLIQQEAKWVPDTVWIFWTAETSFLLRRIKPPIVQPILFYIKYTHTHTHTYTHIYMYMYVYTHTHWSLALRSTFGTSFLTSQNVTLTWFLFANVTKATGLWKWVNKESRAHQHIQASGVEGMILLTAVQVFNLIYRSYVELHSTGVLLYQVLCRSQVDALF
jgi:hypothetical protein